MSLDRKEIEALLVFLANDTLEGEERAEVEAAVAADPRLQTELEALKRIRAEMQADQLAHSPGEFGLARLMRDIDRDAAAPVQTAQVLRPRVWQAVAAAAVALLVVQGIWGGAGPDVGGDDIVLAGGAEGDIRVTFSGNATEAEIRALLLELNLVIVDGPSAIGVYTLDAPDDATRDAALQRLQSETALVDSAEAGE